ncbi:MAG: hypothetical protein JWQ64_2743 [Subtercola sp.]|nr:hypothetical protein [Subtercola sp.]
MEGQLPVAAEGGRAVPRAALTVVKPGFTFISAWVDLRSPNDFVPDFTQKPMVTTQGVPAALVPRVQPGSDLAVEFGSTPGHVTFAGV